jgi:Zn-dependent protease with chaperone function
MKFNQFRSNEDQLAIIIAHELAHAILGHSVG